MFIPVLKSRSQQQQKRGGGMCVEYFCLAFFVVGTDFTKLEIILFLNRFRKIVEPVYKNYNIFYTKNCHKFSEYGLGIRDPRSRGQKAPEPDSWIRNTGLMVSINFPNTVRSLKKFTSLVCGSLIFLLKSFPSRTRKFSPGLMMPHLVAMALAVLILSPVTMRTVIPALWHLRIASGTSSRTGSLN